MAVHQWTANLVQADPQQVGMRMLLSKCGLQSCGIVIVQEIATDLGLSIGLVHSILTEDLHMRRVTAKFVHHDNALCACNSGFLTISQTQHSCGLSGSILTRHGSVWLLAIFQAENDVERDPISNPTAALYTSSHIGRLPATDAIYGREKIHSCTWMSPPHLH